MERMECCTTLVFTHSALFFGDELTAETANWEPS